MPSMKPSGQRVRVSFSVRRPKTTKGKAPMGGSILGSSASA